MITNGHDTGTARFFAANGDSVSTTVTGGGFPIEPNLFQIEEGHTITGEPDVSLERKGP